MQKSATKYSFIYIRDKQTTSTFPINPVLNSHPREAQKVAALGRWLLNGGEL